MKRISLFLVLLLTVLVAPRASALTAKADNTVSYNENTSDNAFFAGNIVDVNSKIDGLGFTAGNSVIVKGKSDYGFVAGNSINISNYETKDLFVAGSTINISDTKVRAIYAAGNIITIQSDATTVYAGGNNVTLNGTYEDLYVDAEEFNFKGTVKGKLVINDDCKVNVEEGAKIATTETYKGTSKSDEDFQDKLSALVAFAIVGRIVSKVLHFINILIIGFLFILLFKKTVKKIENTKGGAGFIFAKFGFGLLALLFVPVLSIILLITGFASALGVISLVLYGLALYLGEIIGTLYVAKLLFSKMNNYLRYFLVLLILSVISIIPILGGL
nr:hypothetical protein [Bacilli bacterium]